MAGVACFSGRVAAQHPHTDVYAFVPTRQAHRLSQFALAAPSQRLRTTRDCKQGMIVARAAIAMPELGGPLKVDDVMTKRKLFSVREDTSIDEALELIVAHRISGLPVLDAQDRVVGVVSDYDLLSLDAVSGKMQETGFFPRPETNWDAFHQIQKLVLKNAGKSVADVMTESPIVVRPTTDMTSAARLLLDTKVRRLPVVDDDGRLVGIFTRGDVIKAALEARRSAAGSN
ncbi:hypothetical protein CVIRNUC_000858 [Coccomyxa viridis]|uniref:CBS domain-containing protein n=1 Tax=Coccomyxa viridis TaxID=1274662 RepID=A0AAV1HRI0_9CHLO|nr:hypothetical protein CVIRNUC_000858 [Coccomyxa viridis]